MMLRLQFNNRVALSSCNRRVYQLQQGELWYAFNRQVSDKKIQQLQKAIDALRETPGKFGKTRYQDILIDYL